MISVVINGVRYVAALPEPVVSTDTLGELLARARLAWGISLAAVGKRVSLSKSYLHDLEHDRINPSLAVTVKLADFYCLSVSDLVAGYRNTMTKAQESRETIREKA